MFTYYTSLYKHCTAITNSKISKIGILVISLIFHTALVHFHVLNLLALLDFLPILLLLIHVNTVHPEQQTGFISL